jgi:hypothetical protein
MGRTRLLLPIYGEHRHTLNKTCLKVRGLSGGHKTLQKSAKGQERPPLIISYRTRILGAYGAVSIEGPRPGHCVQSNLIFKRNNHSNAASFGAHKPVLRAPACANHNRRRSPSIMTIYYLSTNRRKVIKFPVRMVHRPHSSVARARRELEPHLERVIDASSRFGAKLHASE